MFHGLNQCFSKEALIKTKTHILPKGNYYEPEFGSPKKPMFPEAEILHYLDMIDARMYDMEEALYGIEPGAFSERIRTLDNRRMYRPAFMKKIK